MAKYIAYTSEVPTWHIKLNAAALSQGDVRETFELTIALRVKFEIFEALFIRIITLARTWGILF